MGQHPGGEREDRTVRQLVIRPPPPHAQDSGHCLLCPLQLLSHTDIVWRPLLRHTLQMQGSRRLSVYSWPSVYSCAGRLVSRCCRVTPGPREGLVLASALLHADVPYREPHMSTPRTRRSPRPEAPSANRALSRQRHPDRLPEAEERRHALSLRALVDQLLDEGMIEFHEGSTGRDMVATPKALFPADRTLIGIASRQYRALGGR